MTDGAGDPDIRQRIANTLSILAASPGDDPGALRRNLALSTETLRAASHAVEELEEQLELLTAPELDAARQAQQRGRELAVARQRIGELEAELTRLRAKLEVEEELHDVDRQRLDELKRRTEVVDDALARDEDLFKRFMDETLDRDPRTK